MMMNKGYIYYRGVQLKDDKNGTPINNKAFGTNDKLTSLLNYGVNYFRNIKCIIGYVRNKDVDYDDVWREMSEFSRIHDVTMVVFFKNIRFVSTPESRLDLVSSINTKIFDKGYVSTFGPFMPRLDNYTMHVKDSLESYDDAFIALYKEINRIKCEKAEYIYNTFIYDIESKLDVSYIRKFKEGKNATSNQIKLAIKLDKLMKGLLARKNFKFLPNSTVTSNRYRGLFESEKYLRTYLSYLNELIEKPVEQETINRVGEILEDIYSNNGYSSRKEDFEDSNLYFLIQVIKTFTPSYYE